MKKLTSLLLASLLIFALCTNREVLDRIAGDDSAQEPVAAGSPMLIDGGKKIVYQYGHMTPDKGLKLYYDTIPATAKIPSGDFLKDLQ